MSSVPYHLLLLSSLADAIAEKHNIPRLASSSPYSQRPLLTTGPVRGPNRVWRRRSAGDGVAVDAVAVGSDVVDGDDAAFLERLLVMLCSTRFNSVKRYGGQFKDTLAKGFVFYLIFAWSVCLIG